MVLTGSVGDGPGAALDHLLAPFQTLPAGLEARASVPPTSLLRGRQVLIIDKPDATQAQLRIAGSGLARSAPGLVAAVLGNGVLGDGFSSRLVNEVRVNRGLTYSPLEPIRVARDGGPVPRAQLHPAREGRRADPGRLRPDGLAARQWAYRGRSCAGYAPTSEAAFGWAPRPPSRSASHLADAFRYGLERIGSAVTRGLSRRPRPRRSPPRCARIFPLERYRIVAVGPRAEARRQLKRFQGGGGAAAGTFGEIAQGPDRGSVQPQAAKNLAVLLSPRNLPPG